MWILKIYQRKEVLPDVEKESVIYRQYFVDGDADKACELVQEFNDHYQRDGCDNEYHAIVARCTD